MPYAPDKSDSVGKAPREATPEGFEAIIEKVSCLNNPFGVRKRRRQTEDLGISAVFGEKDLGIPAVFGKKDLGILRFDAIL